MTTRELVDQYFSENKYGPHVRSRAGMLASEAYQLGIETANKIADLARQMPGLKYEPATEQTEPEEK